MRDDFPHGRAQLRIERGDVPAARLPGVPARRTRRRSPPSAHAQRGRVRGRARALGGAAQPFDASGADEVRRRRRRASCRRAARWRSAHGPGQRVEDRRRATASGSRPATPLVVLESMKMEIPVLATAAGTCTRSSAPRAAPSPPAIRCACCVRETDLEGAAPSAPGGGRGRVQLSPARRRRRGALQRTAMNRHLLPRLRHAARRVPRAHSAPRRRRVAAPIVVARPCRIRSGTSHPSIPPAAPRWVATNALEASPSGRERAAGVEPEPPEPQDPRAEQHHRQVVRAQRAGPEVAPAPAEEQRRRQRGRAGVHVHDRPAGEVQGSEAGRAQEAAAPDPVRDGRVHEDRPQRDEQDVAAEAHPLGERTRDERRRDDREHQLEDHERRGGDGRCQRDRLGADPRRPT